MPKNIMIVYSDPVSADQEEIYNEWYTQKHLNDVMKIRGFVSATRYKLEKSVPMEGIPSSMNSYVAIYEVDAPSPERMSEISSALWQKINDGVIDIHSSLDFKTLKVDFCAAISDRVIGGALDD